MRDEFASQDARGGPANAIRGPLGQQLVRGGGWALLARVAALPIGVLQTMLLTRILAPAEIGTYFLAFSLIPLLAITAQGGMSRPMVMLVASALATDRPQAARHALRVAFVLALIGGAIIGALIAGGPGHWLVAMLHDGSRLPPLLPIVALLILAFALVDLSAQTLRGFHDLRAASLLSDMLLQRTAVILILGTCWLLAWPIDLGMALTVALCAAVLALAVALASLQPHLGRLGRHGTPWSTREVLRHGPPFLLIRVNHWLMAGADLWMVGMFRPPEEVAIYGAASRLAMLTAIPLAVCTAALAPAIAELHARGERERLERMLRAAATLSTVPSLVLVAAFALFGDALLATLFGEPYGRGQLVMVILALGQWINVTFGPCGLSLTMTGHQRDVMTLGLLTAAGVVVLYLLVAPAYGAMGVAAVTATAFAISNLALASTARRRLGIATWPSASLTAFRRLLAEVARARG